ncbi:MAG: hypothetical protein O7D94_03215 [Planctomycetota bacterium]|nr:hypothetical protein [Planctomycetota bacterium]
MRTSRSTLSAALAVLVALPAIALAQVPDHQNKLLSKRAAEADAYRKLAETINGLRITSDTIVRDFVTVSDTIRSELDTFIRGVRFGKPRWDSELMCMIEAEVTVAKVIQELKAIHKRHYKDGVIKSVDFESIKQYIKKNVIKVVGMGAPRPDLPPDVPGGDIPTTVNLPDPVTPAIWLAVPPNERLMAVRAAALDAMRRLVERLKGVRITSETTVRDFVAESDQIWATAQSTLTGASAVGRPYYHHDELIVEVTYEVPVQSVITTINELHKRHYKGNKITSMDIKKVTKHLQKKKFQAVGMGVPRPQFIKAVVVKTGTNIPDWASNPIRAEGSGVPPEDKTGTPQGKLMAARAAELDAKRRLAEEIMGLQIDSSTMVRDFVTEHDEINTQVDTVLVNSYVKSTNWDSDGTATVIVEIPGMQVWKVVNTYVLIKNFP